jgi:hypothetical protein
MNLIQGTLLGSRELLGAYPVVERGEDTPLVLDLVRRGCSIARLGDRGYLYIYVYNGRNAWELEHHAAISALKRRPKELLLEHEAALRFHLADYRLDESVVMMPHDDGALFIQL